MIPRSLPTTSYMAKVRFPERTDWGFLVRGRGGGGGRGEEGEQGNGIEMLGLRIV